jgi:hypothetical protein
MEENRYLHCGGLSMIAIASSQCLLTTGYAAVNVLVVAHCIVDEDIMDTLTWPPLAMMLTCSLSIATVNK